MKRYVFMMPMMFVWFVLSAQNGAVLRSIEENNKELQTLRSQCAAQKLENKTGVTLPGPELGFDYLWGTPSEIGSRKDFNITQRLDFSTLSGSKGAVANAKNRLVDVQYEIERRRILLQARQLCVNLVYNNILLQKRKERRSDAVLLTNAYASRLEKGDANILEYNRARMNLTTVSGLVRQTEIERQSLLSELMLLNGGHPIVFDDDSYGLEILPENLDSFYADVEANNPQLLYVAASVNYSERQLRLSKEETMPSLSAGYMGEWVSGENYQGLTLGLSIPLWENKNKVKRAKASVLASENRREEVNAQLRGRVKSLYQKASEQKKVADDFRNSLSMYNGISLLKKALDSGQISLLDYLTELNLYYEVVNQQNEAERDYRLTLAELLWY